jgi:hypothetical protein
MVLLVRLSTPNKSESLSCVSIARLGENGGFSIERPIYPL